MKRFLGLVLILVCFSNISLASSIDTYYDDYDYEEYYDDIYYDYYYDYYSNSGPIRIMVNGEFIEMEVEPEVVNERTMIPVRAISENLNWKVDWLNETKSVVVESEYYEVRIKLYDNKMVRKDKLTGEIKEISMESEMIEKNGRTLLPVRFVAEAMGLAVNWDRYNNAVIITDIGYFIDILKEDAPNFYNYVTKKHDSYEKYKDDTSLSFDAETTSSDTNMKLNGKSNISFIMSIPSYKFDLTAKIKYIFTNGPISNTTDIDAFINAYMNKDYLFLKTNLLRYLDYFTYSYLGDDVDVENNGIKIIFNDAAKKAITEFEETYKRVRELDKDEQLRYSKEAIATVVSDMYIWTSDMEDYIDAYKMGVTLLSDKHFTIKETRSYTDYTWKINKDDLLELSKKIANLMEYDKEELAEIEKEFLDTVKNFDIEFKIRESKDIIESINVKFNFNLTPYEFNVKLNSTVDRSISNHAGTIKEPNTRDAHVIDTNK